MASVDGIAEPIVPSPGADFMQISYDEKYRIATEKFLGFDAKWKPGNDAARAEVLTPARAARQSLLLDRNGQIDRKRLIVLRSVRIGRGQFVVEAPRACAAIVKYIAVRVRVCL